ncbi:substrate-binding domain-containing protein [Sandarakinorhabdus glacialis]|uniref:substrate-binding domain-containing protein n=1 Tax=Sandarakinorhabdus glacialis TaxID=1614636 RepID=UPI001664726C|nr:substrate-binding domain-containing protein [Polymorphobacter glacialis]
MTPRKLSWRLIGLTAGVAVLIVAGLFLGLFTGSGGFRDDNAEQSAFGAMSATILRVGDTAGAGERLASALVAGYLRRSGCAEPQVRSDTGHRAVYGCSFGDRAVNIPIAAPGSSVAIAGLVQDDVDVALMTRRLNDTEVENLRARGGDDMLSAVNEQVIGIDAIAIIVHPSNPIARLSPQQLAAVFDGRIDDFGAIGGRPGPIRVVAPLPGMADDDALAAMVLGGRMLTRDARQYGSAAEIAAAVADDPAAIGVVDPVMLLGTRAVPIGPEDGLAVLPTPLAIASGDYVLARPLYLYRQPHSVLPDVPEFMAFAGSAAGQEIVASAGFLPLVIRRYADPLPPGAPPEYVGLVIDAERLSANFRFKPGSMDFESRSTGDLDRVAARMIGERVTADRIVLIGFDDTPREAGMDMTRSTGLARQVATALAERGLRVGLVRGFGGALPVASNAEAAGRNYNRRVEIWVRR